MTTKHINGLYDDVLDGILLEEDISSPWIDPKSMVKVKNYLNRVLWIDKDIDDTLYDEIRLILQWNREDEQKNIPIEKRVPITCIVHSYGGNLDAAFSLVDCIEKSNTPVKTVNIGSAMSAGAVILLSGTKGYRYCMPLSTALLHDGLGGAQGTYSQVQAQNANYKHVIDTLKDWIISHTLIDKKTMQKWNNKEVFLYAEDQLKYGLVDKIVTNLNDIL